MARLALKIRNSAMAVDALRGSRRNEFDDTTDDRPSTVDGIEPRPLPDLPLSYTKARPTGRATAPAHGLWADTFGAPSSAAGGRTHQLAGPTTDANSRVCLPSAAQSSTAARPRKAAATKHAGDSAGAPSRRSAQGRDRPCRRTTTLASHPSSPVMTWLPPADPHVGRIAAR